MSEETPQVRRGISRTSLVLGGAMWVAVFVAAAVVFQSRSVDPDPSFENASAQSSATVSFPARVLPEFEFEECMGGTISLEDLKGKPWVASFIFTSCPTTCPVITSSMMKLQNRVMKTNDEVMLVTFTVYPEYDTPEIMKTYSETFQPKRDRWKFVTGEKDPLYELIVDGFGVYVKENVGEMKRPGFEVAHSNRVVLVNKDAVPVGTFLGTRDEDMAKLAQILTGKEDFPEPGPALNISTTDGSPLQIQFEVKPVEDSQKFGDEDSSGNDDGSEDQSATETPADNASSEGGSANGEKSLDGQSVEATEGLTTEQPSGSPSVSAAAHNALIDARMPSWSKRLPTINAGLNSLATLFLMFGYVAIKRQNKTVHRNFMISAFLTSVAFLVCYLLYHYLLGKYTGEHGKQFSGVGGWKTVYFSILIPHVLLAALVPFMAIRVFQHAFAERWDAHKKLAKVTFPIWMFVSVSGVVIYGMLYHWPSPADTSPALG